MEKSKFMSLLVAGLLISNLLLVGFIMFSKSRETHEGHPPPGHHRGPRNLIIERLRFSDAQVDKYDELIQWHRSNIDAADGRIIDLKNKLYSTLNTTDTSGRDTVIAAIATEHKNIERVHYKHFEDMRDLCTPEQKPLFEALSKEIASLFAPPPHKRP